MEPEIMPGYTKRVQFGCGNVYIIICENNRQPCRVEVQKGKTGCCERALLEAICRLINLWLSEKKDVNDVIMAISGLRCPNGIAGVGRLSCVDALAREMQQYTVQD